MADNFSVGDEKDVRPRLLIIGLLILIETLLLLNVAVSATDSLDYEAYVVQANQTVSSIAEEYGISPSILAEYNHIRVNTPLKSGSILMVPITVQDAPEASMDEESDSSTVTVDSPDFVPSSGNKITGLLATISAKKVVIRTQPNGGDILFGNAKKGSQLLVVNQTNTHYAVLMSDGSIGWVPRFALDVTNTPMLVDRPTAVETKTISSSTAGQQVLIDTAFEYLGVPYKYGGSLPNNVDCSLFVQTVFRRNGVSLPRTAAQQFRVGAPVEVSDLIPGDRLYFYDPAHTKIGHTGIYIGNGRFIHASSNRGCVAVSSLAESTYIKKYAGARR